MWIEQKSNRNMIILKKYKYNNLYNCVAIWAWLPIWNDAFDTPNMYQKFKICHLNILLYQLFFKVQNIWHQQPILGQNKNQNGGGSRKNSVLAHGSWIPDLCLTFCYGCIQ